MRSAIKAALKDVDHLDMPESRRDYTEVAETLYLHELIWQTGRSKNAPEP